MSAHHGGSINRGAEIEDNPFRRHTTRTVFGLLRASLRIAVFWRHRGDANRLEDPLERKK